MTSRLSNDIKNVISGIVQLAYFMRGGMTYNQIMYSMSYVERDIAIDYVTKRIENEMKSPHPVY